MGWLLDYLSRRALPLVVHQIARDPNQPSREWHSTPIEVRQVSQCLMENLRGQVLGVVSIANAAHGKSVHALEIFFVEFDKSGWILLRSFDQEAFFALFARTGRGRSSQRHDSSRLCKLPSPRKVTVLLLLCAAILGGWNGRTGPGYPEP